MPIPPRPSRVAPAAADPGGRRHLRFPVCLPVRCRELPLRPSRSWRGRTADIGGGGFAVEIPQRLARGARLAIEVRTGLGPMRLEAEVLWTRKSSRAEGLIRHGLRLAGGAEVLDLPLGVLLGEWLRGVARRERKARVPAARRP